MSRPRDDRQKDLLRPALDQIIAMGHPLVRLGHEIDWAFLERRLGEVYKKHDGHPPLPIRLVAGLLILKHMHSLSDEQLCARWIENPYFQYFCGEQVFQHKAPFDRSSLTRWRQRLGEERLAALIQESLRVAHATGALAPRDLERVAVDTTVQPKAIAHPNDARLTHKAIVKVVAFAKANGVALRQSYLRFLRKRLGRLIRDINRKTAGDGELTARWAPLRSLAVRVQFQYQRQRGQKIYSLHAPEVECIGKGKARAPYEFGCKVSVATPITQPRGGQFVLHSKALHGNPFDGHTLAGAIADIQKNTGIEVRRTHVDKGYRGHDEPNKYRVWISGQVRRTTAAIKREMKRRAAIEPVIGHLKAEHRMDRNYLKGRDGDRINAVLAAAGFNFHLLIRWLERLLRAWISALIGESPSVPFG